MYLSRTSKGWARAWALLAAKHGPIGRPDAHSGENWQYMGTFGGEHQFRHRSLNGRRVYENIPEAPGDTDDVHEKRPARPRADSRTLLRLGDVRAWMRAHADEHRDPTTGEVNLTPLVEAWDRTCASGDATLDMDHPAWEVAAELFAGDVLAEIHARKGGGQ